MKSPLSPKSGASFMSFTASHSLHSRNNYRGRRCSKGRVRAAEALFTACAGQPQGKGGWGMRLLYSRATGPMLSGPFPSDVRSLWSARVVLWFGCCSLSAFICWAILIGSKPIKISRINANEKHSRGDPVLFWSKGTNVLSILSVSSSGSGNPTLQCDIKCPHY